MRQLRNALARVHAFFRRASRLCRKNAFKRFKLQSTRIAYFEQLEARRVMATAIWHNAVQPLDVDGVDRIISPLDVLQIVNEINAPKFSNAGGALPRQN